MELHCLLNKDRIKNEKCITTKKDRTEPLSLSWEGHPSHDANIVLWQKFFPLKLFLAFFFFYFIILLKYPPSKDHREYFSLKHQYSWVDDSHLKELFMGHMHGYFQVFTANTCQMSLTPAVLKNGGGNGDRRSNTENWPRCHLAQNSGDGIPNSCFLSTVQILKLFEKNRENPFQ